VIESPIPPNRKRDFVATTKTSVFPIPKSGRTILMPTGADTFDVKCNGVNDADNAMLLGFFCKMGGNVRDFRFQYRDVVHQQCRFDSGAVLFEAKGSSNNVVLPIKIVK